MDYDLFLSTIDKKFPPVEINELLKAMWYNAKKQWEKAHQIVQENNSVYAAWIHAHIHREEGDCENAAYWYNRAGKPFPRISLAEEWEEITKELIKKL